MESAEKNKLFSDIVVRYSEKLYWTIRRIVLNHDDANDVMQNVFVKAWNNLEQFQERSNIYTWLYRIAINESLDFLRRKRDFVSLPTNTLMATPRKPFFRKPSPRCPTCSA